MQALADGITAGTPAAQAEAQNAGQSILDNFNLDTTGAGSAGREPDAEREQMESSTGTPRSPGGGQETQARRS